MDQELNERLNVLLNEGKQVEATSKSLCISQRPPYFDEQRFRRAQATVQKYFTNMSIGSSTGLILLMQMECILTPLLKTGKSRTVPDLYDRYTTTAQYIRKCYESDFYDPSSEGWKYLSMVRGMHQRIHKLMKEDPTVKQTPPYVWVNQYDMAITQFAFIGLFLLRPDKCGVYHASKQETSDVVYYWRLICYYLGIEERFNIFVYHDDVDKQVKFMAIIFKHMKEQLKAPRNEIGRRMGEGFVLAFEGLLKETSWNTLDHWWYPFVSISGQDELTPYTLSDIWKHSFFLFYFKVLFRSETLLSVANWHHKKKLDKWLAKGEENKRKLAKKYKHITYELGEAK